MAIVCQECGRIIVDATQDGGVKIRSRMIIFDKDGQASALCPTCKHIIGIPVAFTGTIENSLPKTKIVVKEDKRNVTV